VPLDECFREQVRATPNDLAVVDSATALTYQELFVRAVALAKGLTAQGVGRESLVGVIAPRSVDAVTAFLGIVLAGGAYVPLDPADSPERVAQVLRTAGVRIALSASGGAGVPALDGVEVRAMDGLARPGGDPWAYRSPAVPEGRSPLAYVMFTSGSTGTPKGVMVEHAGIVRLVKQSGYLDFSRARRILHAAALRFDAATFEIWGALLNGGRLCVVDDETAVVPGRLAAALREHGVDTCWLTAPLFHQVIDEDPRVLASVDTVLTGGDVVSPAHVQRARRASPGLRIVNCYGPTENTTFTTAYPIDEDPDGPIPIGRAIAGTTVAVCGPDGARLPAGQVGELYTGGPGLARGYLNLPELTAARFVMLDGERHYRTGDLVHEDRDGVLHFHGRRDNQVKIRGNLVVTDEVNAAVLAVPGVLDAYTRALDGPAGGRYLVSWVVAGDLTGAAVRTTLRDRLPGYMLPEHVVMVDRLPLGDTGKVDWRALPPPVPVVRDGGQELPADLLPLAQIWAQVLRLPVASIGPDTVFADLGGDSLRLGVVLGRIQQRLGARVSLADVGTTVSPRGLRQAMRWAADRPDTAERDSSGAEPIPAVAEDTAVALHPQQRSLYALWRTEPDSVAYNIPFRLDIRGPLEWHRLRSALAEVVARHDALRMRFRIGGGDGAPDAVVQRPVDGVVPDFEYRPSGPAPTPGEFTRPFDPERPVVPRACLVRHGPEHHELYVDVHHVVFDGVSLRVFVEALLDHYCGTDRPAAAVRYADVAQWSHERVVGGAERADERYWRQRLTPPPPPLAVATDRPRGPRRAVRGAVVRRDADQDWVRRLTRRAREQETTEFAVVAAAYAATLHRLTGQPAFGIGVPVSGRTHPDLEDVIGMFVSTVCLDLRIEPGTRLVDLLAQVDRRTRGALAHQRLPFEQVVHQLGIHADPGRTPLFDAFIALQNIDFYAFHRGDLDVSVEVLNPGTTRFDLNLQIYRRPERLVLDLEYATELFEQSSAEHILDLYLATATELLDDPEQPVRRVAVATGARPMSDFDF
jgi:amino acid adenylation domain-containing protein